MTTIRGARKVENGGRSVSRCPHVDLVVNPMSSRVFLTFSDGNSYALTWQNVAELINEVIAPGNLLDAMINPSQLTDLLDSIARRGPGDNGD